MQNNNSSLKNVTRRDFLKTSALLSATALAAGISPRALAAEANTESLRIGIVGCGGRGTGAAVNALTADPNVKIVAMGDVFADRLERSRGQLMERLGEAIDVPEERCFVGFDAYQRVIDTDCDVVILASPPGFRPEHIRAAVDAGKHIFAEKPVAVDPTGVRSVLESARRIDEKNLCFVAGTQYRHTKPYQETIQRIQDGAIGEIVAAQCYYLTGGLWMHPRQEGWTDMEWQLRNWLYFGWLSGDIIVEQHVHNLDVINWAFGGHPVSALGIGGREVRTDPAYGHVYDHFTVEYVYPNGQRMTSMCRQMDGCTRRIADHLVGTKGTADPAGEIRGENAWKYQGRHRPGLVEEHAVLLGAIRSGNRVNDAQRIAESTLTAILGRLSAYSGQELTWEQALNLELDLRPERLEFGDLPVPPVAIPGRTKIV
jgi:predicted dehydrogenase